VTPGAAARLAAEWGARVRANRQQVERFRETAEADDFYAPTAQTFVDDPRRTDDPVLDAILALAEAAETWLDIGAGAGRFALPLALRVREVVALDPSAAMRDALRQGMTAHGIANVRIVNGRWPANADGVTADVVLMAHVGYDIEEIGSFLDAAEHAARRLCIAVMTDRPPPSMADAFWPPVHGVERATLPALPELIELLRSRGVEPRVREVPRPPRAWADEDELRRWMRRQLWVEPGSTKEQRLQSLLDAAIETDADGVYVGGGPRRIGIVDWAV
jgi:SAM-dependent methyltransferase